MILTIAAASVGISTIVAFLAYSLGKLYAYQRRADQLAHLSLIASMWACAEAKGLQKSTVIQRIIEKYSPMPTVTDEQKQKMEEAWESLGNVAEAAPKKKRTMDDFMDSFDFDEELAKDLV